MSPSHKPRYFTDHSRYGSLGKPGEQVMSCVHPHPFIIKSLNGRWLLTLNSLLNGMRKVQILSYLHLSDIICQWQFVATCYWECFGWLEFSSTNWPHTNEQVQTQCCSEVTRGWASCRQKKISRSESKTVFLKQVLLGLCLPGFLSCFCVGSWYVCICVSAS